MLANITISEGLPDAVDGWPAVVRDVTKNFQSGDVIEDPPLFYYADPHNAIWVATRDYTETSERPEIVDAHNYRPKFGVITSQTCDIGEIDFQPPQRPWVMVSPVYDLAYLEKGRKKSLRKGRDSLFLLHLPSLTPDNSEEFWVADLRIEVPIEKSALAGRVPIRSFPDDLGQRAVAQRVADIRQRPAWDTALLDLVSSLNLKVESTRRNNNGLWDMVTTQFAEIGARVDSMLEPTTAQLCAFCDGPVDQLVQAWWMEFFEEASFASLGVLALQESIIEDLRTCSVLRYREFQPIPFRHFNR